MKKRKLLSKLLAIKSENYNSEFHSDYQKQKRNSPLIKSRNQFPKINHTSSKNFLLPINLHKSLNSLNITRNNNNDNNLNNYRLNSPYLEAEQIYYPKIFQNNLYLKDSNSPFKTKIQKKDNSNSLSLKYLELFQQPKEYDYIYLNDLAQNDDNFFENEIIEKITDPILKQNILERLKRYKEKDNIVIENFVRKTFNKLKHESFLLIEKIHDEDIEFFAENIYKEILIKNNREQKQKEMIKVEVNENEKKNNEKTNELIIHNIFFEFAVNNTRKKIELRNQYNKEISIKYISKLISNEIKKLKSTLLKIKYLLRKTSLFSTIESNKNKNRLILNSNKSNSLSNNFTPLTDRYHHNFKQYNQLNNNSININESLNMRKNLKDSDYKIDKRKFNNIINHNNNDNMYITGIKSNYRFLLENNFDINSFNNGNKTNKINLQNYYRNNMNYFNNIKTVNHKGIESYINKGENIKNSKYNENINTNTNTIMNMNISKNNSINFNNSILPKIKKEIKESNKNNNININLIKNKDILQKDNSIDNEIINDEKINNINFNKNNKFIEIKKSEKIIKNKDTKNKQDTKNKKDNLENNNEGKTTSTEKNIEKNKILNKNEENKEKNLNNIDKNSYKEKKEEKKEINETDKKIYEEKINKEIKTDKNENIENKNKENINNIKKHIQDIDQKIREDKNEKKENNINQNNENYNDLENKYKDITFNSSFKDKDKEENNETINNSNFIFNKEPYKNNLDNNNINLDNNTNLDNDNINLNNNINKNLDNEKIYLNNNINLNNNVNKNLDNEKIYLNNNINFQNNNINKEEKDLSVKKEKQDIIEDKIDKIQNKEEQIKSGKKETQNKNRRKINKHQTIITPTIKKIIKLETKRFSARKKDKTKKTTQKFTINKNQLFKYKDNKNINTIKDITEEKEEKEKGDKKSTEYRKTKRKRYNTVIQRDSSYKDSNNHSNKKSTHSKDKSYKSNSKNNNIPRKNLNNSIKNKKTKHSNNNSQYDSQDISDYSQSGINSTQRLNISENTGSAEELTLKDEDLDKLINYINKKKEKEKIKTIPEEENEINLDNVPNKNIFKQKENKLK